MQQRLSQFQVQKLTLSPQIRQYLKFLQLPVQQIETVLEQEMNDNPALEVTPEDPSDEALPDDNKEETKTGDEQSSEEVEELNFQEQLKKLDELDENFKESLYTDFAKNPRGRSSEEDEKQTFLQSLITQKETLQDFLTFQMHMLELSEEEKTIVEEIIGNTNEDGYLTATVEEISASIQKSRESVENTLLKVQQMDPPGVFARSLGECLLIQLSRQSIDTHLAKNIVQNHLGLLEKRDFGKLSKKLKTSVEHIQEACSLIAHLDPKPGRMFFRDEALSVIPDASVYRDPEKDELVIEMNEEPIPRLRINPQFRKMLKEKGCDGKTKEFLKNKVNSALWLIRALDQRQSTLKEITKQIIHSQEDFFEQGFGALKPLRLKDIAQNLNIHESTVSRAISGKYIRTPLGTIPYKSFFSTKMESLEGNESQKSIMEKIRKLITSESSSKPLSDEKIAELLHTGGIKIARRTTAKYRELLKILPSYLRKNTPKRA
ncbi:MAG: RNA polymerase factor sigma-54 [Candidatus Omnitrophica bacterium]|nr:RNA polymerase factor sigma-54 [Candidatus Omnitrophota bacterium]